MMQRSSFLLCFANHSQHQSYVRLFNRLFSTSNSVGSVFDPRIFAEPIVTMEELNKPLPADDERHFKYLKPMKSYETPVFYRNALVDKMVSVCQKQGKRELSRANMLGALELVKRAQYEKWLNEKDEKKRAAIVLDPMEIANRAILNCRPVMKLCPMLKAGIIYQVPFPTNEKEAIFKAMKMMRDICRKKAGRKRTETRKRVPHFKHTLASEFLAASVNEGFTIQAKQELHKLCEKNRAYSNLRRY